MVLLQIFLMETLSRSWKNPQGACSGRGPMEFFTCPALPVWFPTSHSLKSHFSNLRETAQIKGVEILCITGREINLFHMQRESKMQNFIPKAAPAQLNLTSKWEFDGIPQGFGRDLKTQPRLLQPCFGHFQGWGIPGKKIPPKNDPLNLPSVPSQSPVTSCSQKCL